MNGDLGELIQAPQAGGVERFETLRGTASSTPDLERESPRDRVLAY
jgi:hypothetical protein